MSLPYDRDPSATAVRPRLTLTLGAWLLIAANLVPVVGVFLFDWQISDLFLLYWLESAVVGFYNVLKMLMIGRIRVLGLCIFFTLHFGGFMAGHFIFISSFVAAGALSAGAVPPLVALWPAVLALIVSHGCAFIDDFVKPQVYRTRKLNAQMSEPYARIFVMQLSIIFGGIAASMLGAPIGALLLLIALKIAVDLRAYLRTQRAALRG